MTSHPDTRTERVTPPPPRPRNRLLWAGLVLGALAVVAGAVIALQFKAGRDRLDAEVASRRAAGEPMLPEDFARRGALPDDQNAAFHLIRAAADAPELYRQGPGDPLYDAAETRPLTDEQMRLLADEIARHPAALAEARKARGCAEADWGVKFQTPMLEVALPDLNAQRTLASLLKLAAVHRHQAGDDAAAVETLRDLLAMARALDRVSLLVPQLIGQGITSMASEAATDVAELLRVDPSGAAAADTDKVAARPATAGAVRALIGDLLDEEVYRRGIRDAWRGQRMEMLDALRVAAGRSSPLMAFRLRRDAIVVLRTYDRATEAALQPTWPAAKPKIPPAPPGDNWLTEAAERAMTMATMSNGFVLQYRLSAERRVAAVALAAALFRADHDGRNPARLADLVPKYLPAGPADPFAPDGGALKLIVRGDTGPLVYSVGEDGKDDGGDETLLGRQLSWRPGFPEKSKRAQTPTPQPRSIVNVVHLWNSPDAVYHLTGRNRLPEPEPEPAGLLPRGIPGLAEEPGPAGEPHEPNGAIPEEPGPPRG